MPTYLLRPVSKTGIHIRMIPFLTILHILFTFHKQTKKLFNDNTGQLDTYK